MNTLYYTQKNICTYRCIHCKICQNFLSALLYCTLVLALARSCASQLTELQVNKSLFYHLILRAVYTAVYAVFLMQILDKWEIMTGWRLRYS